MMADDHASGTLFLGFIKMRVLATYGALPMTQINDDVLLRMSQ